MHLLRFFLALRSLARPGCAEARRYMVCAPSFDNLSHDFLPTHGQLSPAQDVVLTRPSRAC